MTVRQRASIAWGVLWTLLLLPARVIEEGIHAIASIPFAERVLVSLTPGEGGVETAVQYRESTPQWAIALAHIAPEAIAGVAGAATIAWWIVGGAVWWPASTLDWILLWWLGVQYLAIAMPEQGSPFRSEESEVYRAQAAVDHWVLPAIGVAGATLLAAAVDRFAPSFATPDVLLAHAPALSRALLSVVFVLSIIGGVWMWWGVSQDAGS